MSFLWSTSKKTFRSKSTISVGNKSSYSINEEENNQHDTGPKSKGIYSIEDCPRILEHRFGESLGYRTHLLNELALSDKLGLGPPDMVHMTLFDTYHNEEIGEYFYITGIDVSSSSMPIAFLKILKLNQLKLQENHIATYCCTNIFSNIDIRIRYESDDTVQISAIDCIKETTLNNISEEMWEETYISCCIRSLIMNRDIERKLPGLVEFPLAIENGSISSAKRVIRSLCKFLPRCLDSGWDTTQNIHPTILHNYLVKSLLLFLSICPNLVDYAIVILKELIHSDTLNELYYKITLIAIIEQYDERDTELIKYLNETLGPLLPLLDTLKPRDTNSAQLLNCISSLLNLQAKFLIRRNDFELALSVAKMSTELSLDSPASWYYLAKCYINLGYYEKALLAINSMPNLPAVDKNKKALFSKTVLYDYYVRPLGNTQDCMTLNSNEFNILSNTMKKWKENKLRDVIFGRIVMPNESKQGYIPEIWDKACVEIGPVYGPQSCNSINFVSPQEVKSIADTNLLSRNTIAKQYSWFQKKVVQLLMEMITNIGWNDLLQLRTNVFVMEVEYADNEGFSNISNKDIPMKVRQKRICERWLDQMFLDIYDDLRISKVSLDDKDIKYSGLEWELLGLTMLRSWNWQDGIACLRTSIKARFDYVSCKQLLELFMDYNPEGIEIIDPEFVLELVTQKISYEKRFYDGFQLLNLQVLFKLSAMLTADGIKSRITSLPYATRSMIATVDNMLDWVVEMTKD